MTVEELIDILKQHPPKMKVMVDGYEEGVLDLQEKLVYQAQCVMNYHGKGDGISGPHRELASLDDPTEFTDPEHRYNVLGHAYEIETALILARGIPYD